MACNQFIDVLLANLSLENARLWCPIIRLQIQIDMQYPYVIELINYFLMVKPEYMYNWKNQQNKTDLLKNYLTNLSQFVDLKKFMIKKHLITKDEAIWLDDAIHKTLITE